MWIYQALAKCIPAQKPIKQKIKEGLKYSFISLLFSVHMRGSNFLAHKDFYIQLTAVNIMLMRTHQKVMSRKIGRLVHLLH